MSALASEMSGSMPDAEVSAASTGTLAAVSRRGRRASAGPVEREVGLDVGGDRLLGDDAVGAELENAVPAALSAGVGARRARLEVARVGCGDRVAVLVDLGLPFLPITGSANCWPMIFEPTSLPST